MQNGYTEQINKKTYKCLALGGTKMHFLQDMQFIGYVIVSIIGLAIGYVNATFIHLLSKKESTSINESISIDESTCIDESIPKNDLMPKKEPLPKAVLGCALEKLTSSRSKDIWVYIMTGIIFVLVFAKYKLTMDFIFFAFLLSILIIVFFVDFNTKTIPNGLVLTGLAGGLIVFLYNLFQPLVIYSTNKWWEPLLGLLPGSGFLLLIAILGSIIYRSGETMGMGDIKIFAPVGMFLGWKMCTLALLISMLLGGTTSLLLIILKIKKRKDTIPFGPFITVASLIVIFFGKHIWTWYFSFL